MTNRFSGKISFNKLLFLIGVPLKSIQVKEWNKKNVINRSINLWKKLLNFESEYKRQKRLNRIKLSCHNKSQINHPISFLLKEPISSWSLYTTWEEQTQV